MKAMNCEITVVDQRDVASLNHVVRHVPVRSTSALCTMQSVAMPALYMYVRFLVADTPCLTLESPQLLSMKVAFCCLSAPFRGSEGTSCREFLSLMNTSEWHLKNVKAAFRKLSLMSVHEVAPPTEPLLQASSCQQTKSQNTFFVCHPPGTWNLFLVGFSFFCG